MDQSTVGWYYCENPGERTVDACSDGVDNDDDSGNGVLGDAADLVDCDDTDCADCINCGGNGANCDLGCKYDVDLTGAAKNAVTGQFIKVRCLNQAEVPDGQCKAESNADLGVQCQQTGFDEAEYQVSIRGGPYGSRI